jgi:hypothetical protein
MSGAQLANVLASVVAELPKSYDEVNRRLDCMPAPLQ